MPKLEKKEGILYEVAETNCRSGHDSGYAVLLPSGGRCGATGRGTDPGRDRVDPAEAATDYNADVTYGDILKGYPGGDLNEDGAVTRAQALVMLQRAFGGLA